MTRQYIITRLSVNDSDGEMNSYLEAVCDTEEAARELLQDAFNDANQSYENKLGAIYSNPEWINKDSFKMTCSLKAGYSTLSYTETLFLSWTWKERTYNPKWILE